MFSMLLFVFCFNFGWWYLFHLKHLSVTNKKLRNILCEQIPSCSTEMANQSNMVPCIEFYSTSPPNLLQLCNKRIKAGNNCKSYSRNTWKHHFMVLAHYTNGKNSTITLKVTFKGQEVGGLNIDFVTFCLNCT